VIHEMERVAKRYGMAVTATFNDQRVRVFPARSRKSEGWRDQ
jgi:hypothetical protein